MKMPGWRCGA